MASDEDFRYRLNVEFTELGQKIKRLKAFIVDEGFEKLDSDDRRLLREQLTHMKAYHDVLLTRVGRLANNA
jgi:predicted DNA-binding helix-hairpin-helix protein